MTPEQDERLRAVETGQATLQKAVEIHLANTTKIIERHDRTLFHTEKGLSVRLDREEQKSKTITRLIWIVVTGAVGTGVTLAATAIF